MNAARILLVFVVLLAGCSASPAPDTETPANATETDAPTATPTATATATDTPTPTPSPDAYADPEVDRLGWEAGYWYDEGIDVDQSDGLNESERRAFVARTMARVEQVRGLEFTQSIPVEVISRDEYQNRSGPGIDSSAWNEQVWESLFLIGEDRRVNETFDELYSGSVLGYYSPGEGRIVIVSNSETPTIDRETLSHELVHALQDQHFTLESGETQDVSLAHDGLYEGDAKYVERLYEERCRDEWACVPRPESGGGGGVSNIGVYVTIFHPYSDGPAFVHELHERGGWGEVNAAYSRPPESTAQVIHPADYPSTSPVQVGVTDRSSDHWHRFDHTPRTDTVGEASLYAMFWANGQIESSHLHDPSEPYRGYNYTHRLTAGWRGDTVVPYQSDGGEYGYVFKSEWETEADAEEFAEGYRDLLQIRYDAAYRGANAYEIQAGPYADAFRVTQSGTTVTVVNAPTVETLDDVHPE